MITICGSRFAKRHNRIEATLFFPLQHFLVLLKGVARRTRILCVALSVPGGLPCVPLVKNTSTDVYRVFDEELDALYGVKVGLQCITEA